MKLAELLLENYDIKKRVKHLEKLLAGCAIEVEKIDTYGAENLARLGIVKRLRDWLKDEGFE